MSIDETGPFTEAATDPFTVCTQTSSPTCIFNVFESLSLFHHKSKAAVVCSVST